MRVAGQSVLGICSHSVDFVLQNTGWWTYKFCYGQGLTQFHRYAQCPVRVQAASSLLLRSENVVVASDDKTQPPQQQVRVTAEFDLGHGALRNSTDTQQFALTALGVSQWLRIRSKSCVERIRKIRTRGAIFCS